MAVLFAVHRSVQCAADVTPEPCFEPGLFLTGPLCIMQRKASNEFCSFGAHLRDKVPGEGTRLAQPASVSIMKTMVICPDRLTPWFFVHLMPPRDAFVRILHRAEYGVCSSNGKRISCACSGTGRDRCGTKIGGKDEDYRDE